MADDTPLKDGAEEAEEGDEEEESTSEPETSAKPARPPPPKFKFSTFLLTFLFVMGLVMVFDRSTREGVARDLGVVLTPLIGFAGHYFLLTMLLAGVLEMAITAVAYNWATDWIKTAKVQAWAAAFRKVQMPAIRSGKKDKIAALQPHQNKLSELQMSVTTSQLKGMAITWFLLIAIYTWVYLFLAQYALPPLASGGPTRVLVDIGGGTTNLFAGLGPIQLWFLLFTLYTVPFSILFRRLLKHLALRQYERSHPVTTAPATAGNAA